ncbi:MAG: 4-hydroxy-tetrahydrodipicolinate synthase [Bowdeniella nasicola]|nr:4-hydroxy-tetrahydrodipicolinate synthase [Bowdeniella nasicola]
MDVTQAREIFGSVIPALVTPFTEQGIDEDAMAGLATHLVAKGCDGLLVSGTTGESPTTYSPEKVRLIEVVRDAVGPDVPIMAGAGSNDTAHACRMAEQAAAAGANSLLVVTPYYNKPSQAGIVAHIRAVGAAGGLPVMVYDIPGRCGVSVSAQAAQELADDPHVVAYKDATGDPIAGAARAQATDTAVYSGDDGLNLAFLTHGGAGVVSVVAHVAADRYRAMVDALNAGDLQTARQIHNEVLPLVDAIMGTGQGAVMAKTAMALQGIIPSARLRLPLVAASEEQIGRMRREMEKLGYL